MAAVPVTTTIQTQIANLYIAILGRNPEPAGFGYWCDTLANNGGTQAALNAITMGFSNSPEFVATYGGQTTSAAIGLMYTNVLNRTADAGGLAYWTAQYNALINTGSYTVAQALALTGNAIITAAAANTGTADQTLILAKEATAIASGTSTPTTTYTLTTSAETITGASNVVVNGLVDVTAANSTLTAADSITLSGTNNTLNITKAGAGAIASATNGSLISGVQTVNLRATGTGGTTLDASQAPGVTSINNNLSSDTGGVTLTNVASTTTLTVTGNGTLTTQATTATYKAGTAAQTVNLNGGVSGGAITLNGDADALLTTLTINSNGATNTVGGIATPAAVKTVNINAASALITGGITTVAATTTITVSGAAANAIKAGTNNVAVDLGTLAANVRTVNAAGLTAGGIYAVLSGVAQVVTGGAGNDVISTGVTLTTGSVTGGAGGTADTLLVTNTNATNSLTLGAKYTNFEILGTAAAVTVDVDNLAAGNTFTGSIFASGGTMTNMNAAMAANVTAKASGTFSFGIKGATDPATSNVLNITADDGNSGAVTTVELGAPAAAGVETISITSNDKVIVTGLTNVADLTTLTLAGAQTQVITSGALALNPSFTVNAAAATGALTLNFTAATTRGGVFNLGTAADTLAATSQLDAINGGAGNDIIIGDSNAEVQTLTIAGTVGAAAGVGTLVINGTTVTFTQAATAVAADQATAAAAAITTAAISGVTAAAVGAVVTITSTATNGNIAATTYASTAVTAVPGPVTGTVATTTQGGLNLTADVITGGAGTDTVFISTQTGNTANTVANADVLVGWDFGTSTLASDVIKVAGTGTTTIFTLTSAQQATVTAAADLATATALVLNANVLNGGTTQFTYGANTYLAISGDANGTYDAGADYLVVITGATGTLNATDVLFVS